MAKRHGRFIALILSVLVVIGMFGATSFASTQVGSFTIDNQSSHYINVYYSGGTASPKKIYSEQTETIGKITSVGLTEIHAKHNFDVYFSDGVPNYSTYNKDKGIFVYEFPDGTYDTNFRVNNHDHKWSLRLGKSKAKAIVECDNKGCDSYYNVVATIPTNVEGKKYDGEPIEVTVNSTDFDGVKIGKVYYIKDGDTENPVHNAVEPGTYFAKADVCFDNTTVTIKSNEFTISEPTIDINPNGSEGLVYTGAEQSLIANYAEVAKSIPAGYELRYRVSGPNGWDRDKATTKEPVGTDAGDYTVHYQLYKLGETKDSRVAGRKGKVVVTIAQAENSVTVTVPSDAVAYGAEYEVKAEATFAGENEPTISYFDSNKEALESKPTAAGTYYAKASVAETTNYKGAESDYAEFTISAPTPAPTPSGGGGSVTDPVQVVVDKINALDPNAADYAAKAQDAVDAYNKLTDAQKNDQRLKEQTVATKLAAAEEAVKSEEQKKADQKAADEASALLNKLPDDPSQASEADAMAAYNAYMALTDAQKALLSPAAQEKVAAYAYYYESQYAAAQKVKSFKVKNVKTRKAKATWEKTAGISGYQLTYKTKGTKTKKVTLKASAVKKVVKKLKKGKKYTFRIRTFTKVYNPYTGSYKKVYGSWAKRTVKIKK